VRPSSLSSFPLSPLLASSLTLRTLLPQRRPYPDLIEEYWKRDDVPHHERHPWGSKELIEGKKKYDAMLAEKKAADNEKKAALEGIESGQEEAEEEAGGQAQESDSDWSGDDDDA